MKKIILTLLCLALLLCGCKGAPGRDGISIVATVFPAYDLARAVAGDAAEISMLLDPGTEIHSFEPSAEDILEIQNADIFIYTGGDSDSWIDRVLTSLDTTDKKIIKMVDCSTLVYNDHDHHEDDSHSHDHGPDEHVWLSPDNAKSIVWAVCDALSVTDPARSGTYRANAERYCAEITALAEETKTVIESAPHSTLVVADRFPLKYLCEYYSLEYEAAFDACDLLADADAKTVLRLIDTVERAGISYVFYLENGSGYLADTVCEETGAEKLIINSMHTVSLEDFRRGVTYTDIMRQNIAALERGLY